MTERTHLADYARTELRGQAVYKGYRPRADLLEQVQEALPTAHVVVVSAPWCVDCRREVPKLTRILEALPPTWSVETRGDDEEVKNVYQVQAIPTFIVLDRPGGSELGRIIESPRTEQGIEGDLLRIAQAAALPGGAARSGSRE